MDIFIKLALSGVFSIIVAVLAHKVRNKDKFSNVIFALLVFVSITLIIEVADICERLNSIEEHDTHLSKTIDGIFQDGTPFSDFYNVALISNMRNGTAGRGIIVQREGVPNFWLKTLMFFDTSFLATSHIDPNEGWTLAYTEVGLDLQKMKIGQGKQIRRVFIIETENELELFLPIIREQRVKGIDVRYIYLQEIEEHAILREIEIESLDFVLIDDEFLTIIMLDANRNISYLRLIRDKNEYRKYMNYYTHLFNEAQVPK